MEIVKAASGGTFQSLGLTVRSRPQSPISHCCRLQISTPFHQPFRARIGLPDQRIVCKAKPSKLLRKKKKKRPRVADDDPPESGDDRTVIRIPHTLMVAEREEAKAVLTLFLMEQGLGLTVARRTVRKSDQFVDHLLSKLHSTHPKRYLVGRELTTHEIREVLLLYMESFLEEHGDALVDAVEQFPNPPDRKKTATEVATTPVAPSLKKKNEEEKEEAVASPSEQGSGDLSPQVLYLRDIGFDLDRIKEITRKFPAFARYSLEGKLKPIVEFLLDLGVAQKDIPVILCKRPQLCGVSIKENLIPTMAFLEGLGVDRTQWAKVICRCPSLLTHGKEKFRTTVDYLSELGISAEDIGGILTRFPKIMGYSVDKKLRPIGEYFGSLGIDVATLTCRCPQTFGLSLEGSLKPITKFFLDRGFSIEDIEAMADKYGSLYTLSLAENLLPKWEFFLEMGYSKSDLVTFPNFFGYALEKRIKPRYNRARENGVRLALNQLLSVSDKKFEQILEKRMDNIV